MTKIGAGDLAFLIRVQNGMVRNVAGYKKKRGGYTKFYGGEKTFKRLRVMGLVTIGTPQLGFPAVATLTALGQAILEEV